MKTITVIQPSKTEKKMLRVAAYCRVSSSSEDQLHSFKAQNAYYRALITSNDDWTLADIYADEGISGTSAEKRPEFQRLMDDCRKGKIDLVLAKSISRFARNTKDCIEALRELKKLNIAVRFEKEGIDTSNDSGEMLITMMSAMAQEESISISQNMRWSYQKRMQAGTFITCSAPIGYDLVDGKLVVNPDEAAIVKSVYRLFLSGYGLNAIRKKLNGVISTRGVQYILTNEKYIGDARVQKSYRNDSPPFTRNDNHGEVDQYYVYDSHEPIISKSDFYTVQEILQRKKKLYYSENKVGHWAEGMISCELCGRKYHRKVKNGKVYWICYNRFVNANLCSAPIIQETEIVGIFIEVYNKLRFGLGHVLTPMLQQMKDLQNKMLDQRGLDELKKEELSLKGQNRILADLQVKGSIDAALCASKMQNIKQRLREIRRKISEMQGCENLSARIESTTELINILQNSPDVLYDFDEGLFRQIVGHISINKDIITFHLINELTISEKINMKVKKHGKQNDPVRV